MHIDLQLELEEDQFSRKKHVWTSVAKAFDADYIEQAEKAVMDGTEIVLPPIGVDNDELTWTAEEDKMRS